MIVQNDTRTTGTPDPFQKAFYVAAATKLTSTFAKDILNATGGKKDTTRWAAGWVDTQLASPTNAGLFDLVQFVVTPTIGSANKIRIRIALSSTTKVAGTSQYYREGGQEWFQDFDASDTATRIALDPMSLKSRYFAIEAKYVDGSDTGTAITVEYAFLHSNTSDGGTTLTKMVLNKKMEIIRANTVLSAAGAMSANIDVDTSNARYSSLLGIYTPRHADGKARVEVEKVDTLSSVDYGTPNCPVHRGSIVSAGTYVQTEIRPEQMLFRGPNTAASLTAGSWTGGIATVTAVAHGLRVGDWFAITGTTPSGYDTALSQVVSVTSADIFTYAVTATVAGWSSGGTFWKGIVVRGEWFDPYRFDKIRVRAQEVGNTGAPGHLFLLSKTTEN